MKGFRIDLDGAINSCDKCGALHAMEKCPVCELKNWILDCFKDQQGRVNEAFQESMKISREPDSDDMSFGAALYRMLMAQG